jgi:hypothetical protein
VQSQVFCRKTPLQHRSRDFFAGKGVDKPGSIRYPIGFEIALSHGVEQEI